MSQADIDIKTVVTARESSVGHSVKATTPESVEANVNLVAMPWWKIVLVRAFRTYLFTLVGAMGAGGIGMDVVSVPNDWLPMLKAAAVVALAPAIVSAIWNTLELTAKWDTSVPQMRA